jgi:hypothetical protein
MATLDDINTLPEARFLTLDDKMAIAEQNDRRSPKRINVGDLNNLFQTTNAARGQVSVQGNTTPTDIVTAGVFYEAGINGVLDTTTVVNFVATNNNRIGLQYTGSDTRIFWFYGSADCTAGNNQMLAIRLAKNGTSIPETECRASTAGNSHEAKLVTTWMITLSTNDIVSLVLANPDHTTDITIKRARLVANAIS